LKYNLKNKPKPQTIHHNDTSTLEFAYKDVTDWFVGFERELRQKYEEAIDHGWLARAMIYGEVLGDA